MRPSFRPLECALTLVAVLLAAGCRDGASSNGESAETNPRDSWTNTLEQAAQLKEPFPTDRIVEEKPSAASEPQDNPRDWRVRALMAGYQATGMTNRQWDAQALAAFEAQADYTRESSISNFHVLAAAATTALQAGCRDPMIRYLNARYRYSDPPPEQAAREMIDIHDAMIRSKHHPMFKFYAGWRADEAIRAADWRIKRPDRQNQTTAHLLDLIRDGNAPITEVFDAARIWVTYDTTRNWIYYASFFVDPVLKARSPDTHHWFAYEGEIELKRAWKARGSGWASEVDEAGWEAFRKHLAAARESLESAWELDPENVRTAYLMMRVAQGEGELPEIRAWFETVMKLDPNHYEAAWLMAYSLEPRWFGSRSDALKFARSCVASEVWGGNVPLVLPAIHESLSRFYHQAVDAPDYWHREEVWRDVKSAYEKFFELNPDWSEWRERFAKHAFYCGKYAEFLEQVELLSEEPDYSELGGRERFAEMVEQARRETAK